MTPPGRTAPIIETLPLVVLSLLAVFTVLVPSPWIPAGDSGELAAAVWNLGIPHNPGYPLFVLAGKAFATALPFGSVAFRTALLSGLATWCAVAILLLVLLPRLVGDDTVERGAAALFVGVTIVAERYRALFREGEVYGPALLLLALLAAAVGARGLAPRRRGALAGALALLAILGHYQAAVVIIAALALLLVARRKALPAAGAWAGGLAGALAVVPLLLLLPLRSAADPLPDWGDSERWGNFWFHITGGEHLATRLGLADAGRRALHLVADASSPWGWWALAALVGVAVLARRRRSLLPLLAAVAGEALYAVLLNRVELTLTPFLLASGLLVAAATGIGLVAIARLAAPESRVVAAALVLGACAIALAGSGSSRRDLPGPADRYPQERAWRLLQTVGPGGIAVASGDTTCFPLAYLQAVGGGRPDLTVIDRTNSVFRYPGWVHAKIDAGSRAASEDALADGRPIVALGTLRGASFGTGLAGDAGNVVALAGSARKAPLPDPFPLLFAPVSGMARRTIAEGIFLGLLEEPWAGPRVAALSSIAQWGADDPYLVNEAGIRLFGAGATGEAVRVLSAGAERFPHVPALAANLAAALRTNGETLTRP